MGVGCRGSNKEPSGQGDNVVVMTSMVPIVIVRGEGEFLLAKLYGPSP